MLLVTISTTGKLEFVFGGNNTQAGFYDWGMWLYNSSTCDNLRANTCSQAPVRCNWNGDDDGGTGLMDVLPPDGYSGNYEPGLNVTAGQQYVICFSNYSGAVTSVPLQFMAGPGNAGVQCPVALPIVFEAFEAEIMDNEAARIDWTISGGVAKSNMNLEKSHNGIDWTSIQNYAGINLTETSQFSHVDKSLKPGTNYYRIGLTDYDGSTRYSKIEAIQFAPTKLNVYPNPANSSMTLTLKDIASYSFKIIDVYGREQQILFDVIDNNTIIMNTSHLGKGIYFLKYGNSQGESEVKIEINR